MLYLSGPLFTKIVSFLFERREEGRKEKGREGGREGVEGGKEEKPLLKESVDSRSVWLKKGEKSP